MDKKLEDMTLEELVALNQQLMDQRLAAVRAQREVAQAMTARQQEADMRTEEARLSRRLGRAVLIRPAGIASAEKMGTPSA